jgi:hypothetical protein
MFEPDGRNSLQSIGHGTVTVAKFIMVIFAAIAVAPTYLYLTSQNKLQVQDATIRGLNETGPQQAVLIDFNEATLGAHDAMIEKAWDAQADRKNSLDPGVHSLPFTAWIFNRDGDQWVADTETNPGAYVYYNLPFDQNMVEDEGFHNGQRAGVWEHVDYNSLPLLNGVVDNYDLTSKVFAFSDPWWANGAFKIAQTKNWDWYSGFELAHAKAAPNHRAYVAAARIVTRMRHLYALRAMGSSQTPNGLRGSDILPARAAMQSVDPDRFAALYRQAFKGKLPRVFLQLQDFDTELLKLSPTWKPFMEIYGDDLQHNASVAMSTPTKGPFITGMFLWEGPRRYDSVHGRPVFTVLDYLFNSTPRQPKESKDAQAAMLQLMTEEFWVNAFREEGLGSGADAEAVRSVVCHERERLEHDVQFARMTAHKIYASRDAQ